MGHMMAPHAAGQEQDRQAGGAMLAVTTPYTAGRAFGLRPARMSGKLFEPVNRIVIVVTPHDIERYTNAYGPQQSIDVMREDFHRWIRQLHPF
jgi:hypothetical protein